MHSALFNNRTHNFGAIIARRLSKNRTKGIFFGNIYATSLVAHFNIPSRREEDHELPANLLDFASMECHEFITESAGLNAYKYNLVFNQDTRDIVTLPAPTLFDRSK